MYAKLKWKFIWGLTQQFFINFAILLCNVYLSVSVMQYFRMQGYETHNYNNVFKYAVD